MDLWAAGGVWYKVYFASGDGVWLLGRLLCSSKVELTLLSFPMELNQPVSAAGWPLGQLRCCAAWEGMDQISSGNSQLSAPVHTRAAVGLPSTEWKQDHEPCAVALWCIVEEQGDTVEIVPLLLVLATPADISQGYIFPLSTLSLLRLCGVMGTVPEGLSPTGPRNGAGMCPGKGRHKGRDEELN